MTPTPSPDPQEAHLRDALEHNARDQDRAVMTLAGGALALSLAFLRDTTATQALWLLQGAWIVLGLSLTLTVFSMDASSRNIRTRIGQLGRREPEKTRWRAVTRLTTELAALALLVGVAGLVAFAVTNL